MLMSNSLIYFLQQNLVAINCLVYLLTLGDIVYGDENGVGGQNLTAGFLPAYYITNCSISGLLDAIANQGPNVTRQWEESYAYSPYNKSDNGDTFVALLFTISALCISSWMLTLLLFLTPRHKRKPALTQAATVFYTVFTTVLVCQITKVARRQYYNDTLDIINMRTFIYQVDSFRATFIVLQLLVNAAWLHLVLQLSRSRFKWMAGVLGLVAVTTYTVVLAVYNVHFNNSLAIFNTAASSSNELWRMSAVACKLGLMVWYGITLGYYTVKLRNPRICYGRRLLPLAVVVWLLFAAHIVLNVLTLSVFRSVWLVKIWLILLPYLVEVLLLLAVWEWVYSIGYLEKRAELAGVLGRRISEDDVVSFHTALENDRDRSRRQRVRDFVHKVMGRQTPRSRPLRGKIEDTEAGLYELKNYSSPGSAEGTSVLESGRETGSLMNGNGGPNENVDGNSVLGTENASNTETHNPSPSPSRAHLGHENFHIGTPTAHLGTRTDDFSSNQMGLETDRFSDDDVQYVDDYAIWDDDEPIEGTSLAQPPPFQPHPGFSAEDYWDDKR